MPVPKKYLADFYEGNSYHIYNRTNNKELLFKNDGNYLFFLKQYHFYLSNLIDTYAWCLIPNHFHIASRIKDKKEIHQYLSYKPELNIIEKSYLEGDGEVHPLIRKAFHQLFTSYSVKFNRTFERKGNLFHRPFKRKQIDEIEVLKDTVLYIHTNPAKHFISQDFMNYKWSSFNEIKCHSNSRLLCEEVMNLFGNRESLVADHNAYYEKRWLQMEPPLLI